MPPRRRGTGSASTKSTLAGSPLSRRDLYSDSDTRAPSASDTRSTLPASPRYMEAGGKGRAGKLQRTTQSTLASANASRRDAVPAKPAKGVPSAHTVPETPSRPPLSPSVPPPPKTPAAASGRDAEDAPPNVVVIPTEEHLMRAERLQAIADQLSHSLVMLRTKLSLMEQRIARSDAAVAAAAPAARKATPANASAHGGSRGGSATSPTTSPSASPAPPAIPLLPFQIRRAQLEKEQLQAEIASTSRTIRKLLIMTQQMEGVMRFKEVVFAETKTELETEIAALQAEKDGNLEAIREGFVSRINLLHRYWPWRQLLDLGDTSVGGTFEEELKRGPRYRHVGIQNSIESDYIETQLRWLEQFSHREETFRGHLRRLDTLVEDLHDINDLLESTLTCQVCNLLYEDPVLMWPCGHTFCMVCFESLMIAPSLFRCPICGSMGSEGYIHNLLIGETVAKWMFKDSGYGDLQGPLSNIRVHLSRFRKDRTEERMRDLKALLKKQKREEKAKGATNTKAISISYRAY